MKKTKMLKKNYEFSKIFSKGNNNASSYAFCVIDDLKIPPSNHLETLTGDRQGQHSIRINDQYRICFRSWIFPPVD